MAGSTVGLATMKIDTVLLTRTQQKAEEGAEAALKAKEDSD